MSILGGLVDIRRGERRSTLAGFATLLGITTGHTLLETARDAMFLAKMPASRLPWMYLLIVGFALGLGQVGRKGAAPARGRIAAALALAAVVTGGFWLLAGSPAPWLLYALYVWSGLFASWITVQVWTLLGRIHTMTQAKRLYGFIGAGAVLGAVLGAFAARAAMHALPARASLLIAAAVFLAAAVPSLLVVVPASPGPAADAPGSPAASASMSASMSLLWQNPFARRVLGIVLVSTVTFTFADYLFKAQLAYHVRDPALLGQRIATFYAVTNTLSLVAQLVVGPWVFRTLGVQRALFFFPTGLAAAAGAVVATIGSLASVFLLKGLDGALRYSIHRTSTELLLVPVPDGTRERIKPIVDLVGSRGGQALASLGILFLVAVGAGKPRVLGVVVLTLALVWFGLVATIRNLYLDVFRETLKTGGLSGKAELPELDLGALEAIFAGLNSSRDVEVLASLELLADQHRERLIPALILYHPSRDVVLRALELFTQHGRRDFVSIADRLDGHPDRAVAAAALRARTAVAPDQKLLEARLGSACPQVAVTALVALMARDWIGVKEVDARLAEVLGEGAWSTIAELARAIRGVAAERRPGGTFEARFDEILITIAEGSTRFTERVVVAGPEIDRGLAHIDTSEELVENQILVEVGRAMGVRRSPLFLPHLVAMLRRHELRAAAREAIQAIPGALEALDQSLSAAQVPREVKIHVPRAMAVIEPAAAARLLERQLLHHDDGAVRYRILRALVRLRRQAPDLSLDAGPLLTAVASTLDHTEELRRWGEALASDHEAGGGPASVTHADPMHAAHHLLCDLVRDKEIHATQRLFLLLELLYREDLEGVWRGLRSKDEKARASGLELVENLVKPPIRARLLSLVGDAAPSGAPALSYEQALREILAKGGSTMRTLAGYRAAELGLPLAAEARPPEPADRLAETLGERVAARARDLLEPVAKGGAARAPA